MKLKMSLVVATLAAIVALVPAFAEEHPGKAVYDQSCKNCHGADGKGSNVADKFFGIRIPRLVSNTVQMRSNPELKEIILKGSGRMEPVRMGRPTLPHGETKNLTEQQIVDVIAYVRSLGKQEKN